MGMVNVKRLRCKLICKKKKLDINNLYHVEFSATCFIVENVDEI